MGHELDHFMFHRAFRFVVEQSPLRALGLAFTQRFFGAVARKLAVDRKRAPGSWEERIFFDHRSGYNRSLAAMCGQTENLAGFPAGVDPLAPVSRPPAPSWR